MKQKLLVIASVLILAACVLLGSCSGSKSRAEGDTEKKKDNNASITYTSEEVNAFRAVKADGSACVVDRDGKVQTNYSIDGTGNICAGENVIVKAEDVKQYTYIAAILSLMDSSAGNVELPRQIKPGTVNEIEYGEKTIEYRVYISPADATNPVVKVTSANTPVAEIVSFDGSVTAGSSTVTAKEGILTVYIKCKATGSSQIRMEAADGSEQVYSFYVNVSANELPAAGAGGESGDAAAESRRPEDIITTTESSRGWVTGKNVRFREEPSSTGKIFGFYETGADLVIYGTNTEGWTKVFLDGKVGYIKSEYVTRTQPTTAQGGTQTVITTTGTAPRATATPRPTATVPPANNDGYDHGTAFGAENEQKINRQHTAQESETHTHYYTKYLVVDPTGTEEGYTVFRCECGASFKTSFVPALG